MGLGKLFRRPSIQEMHFISWLIKDIFWCFRFDNLATLMVAPTVILTIYILIKDNCNRKVNYIISSWVMMNVFWMLHEIHGFPFFVAKIFMFLGLVTALKSILK